VPFRIHTTLTLKGRTYVMPLELTTTDSNTIVLGERSKI